MSDDNKPAEQPVKPASTQRLENAPKAATEDAPRLVGAVDDAPEGAVDQASSANAAYWPQVPAERSTSERASNAAQRAAFDAYQARPDIESRASILAREHAAPAEFENVTVPNSNFDEATDGREDATLPGYDGTWDYTPPAETTP